jgi:hypothetical protein
MSNLLVETKNEYTTHLNNILTPLIFEGLQSIYKEALVVAGNNDILKVFQSFLRRVPKWNQTLIDKETNRIINSSHSYGWINDLIKATLKANLIVLMYNPIAKSQNKIDPNFYKDIKTTDFIHKIYIECARELYNNPYLLYHNYPPIEIKRNQRDCMNIIKDCIKEAIRKLLPVKHILQIYLGNDMELNNMNDNVDKVISEVEEKNLTKLINKDLSNDKTLDSPPPLLTNKPNPIESNSEEKTIGSRILNIIENNSPKSESLTDIINNNSSTINKSMVTPRNNSITSPNIESLKQSIRQSIVKPDNKPMTLDDKLKNILTKDLGGNTDIETSISYSQENDKDNYQEIFSNSVTPKKDNNVNNNEKEKKKFFNKYLQF